MNRHKDHACQISMLYHKNFRKYQPGIFRRTNGRTDRRKNDLLCPPLSRKAGNNSVNSYNTRVVPENRVHWGIFQIVVCIKGEIWHGWIEKFTYNCKYLINMPKYDFIME